MVAETAVAIAQWEYCPVSLNIVAIAIAQWERTITLPMKTGHAILKRSVQVAYRIYSNWGTGCEHQNHANICVDVN